MGGKSKKQTVGYKYLIGMHMVFCHGPIDALLKIIVGDREAWSGNSSGGRINVDKPDLFGGEKREGGVSGDLDFEPGDPSQFKNTYLFDQSNGRVSANRGVAAVVLRHVYIGNNPYLKPWAFLVRRIHLTGRTGTTQWYDAKAQIGVDMNPAHIIRECLTDREWGMGYSPSDMGASFTSAADTLHDEGFGMSLLWDRAVPIEDFIKEILTTIDGTLYVDITTGKFELSLARDDYDPNSLPILDESNVISVEDFKRKSSAELINSVTLKYWNQNTYKTDSVNAHDIALIATMGAQVSTVITYDGITDPALASTVATRELRSLSKRLASVTITTTRAIQGIQIGSVFMWEWPRLGVSRMVLRAVEVEYGNLTDGRIVIRAVEDIFATPEPILAPSEPTEWVLPNNPPIPVPNQWMYEANWFDIVQVVGDEAAKQVDEFSGFALIAAEKPTSDTYGGTLHSTPYAGWVESDSIGFCGFAETEFAIGPLDTTIFIKNARSIANTREGSYAYIGNEIVRIDSFSTNSITVGRGCLDTVPTPHSPNTLVVFSGDDAGTDSIPYQLNETVHYKVTPYTGVGELSVANAPESTLQIKARQDMPYPPGRVRINNVAYPTAPVTSTVTITWAHRDRKQQTAPVINDTTAGDIGPETGVTYSLEIRKGGALIEQASGISGTSYTVQATLTSGVHTLRLWAVRDGINSWQRHDFDWEYA